MKVYIAAASSEIERAERWIACCREAAIEVVSTWCAKIREGGAANPADASQIQRRIWAAQDLKEVREADVLWFLLPGIGHRTDGAWCELGLAFSENKWIMMSGQHPSVFTGLASVITETDEAAFKHLREVKPTAA